MFSDRDRTGTCFAVFSATGLLTPVLSWKVQAQCLTKDLCDRHPLWQEMALSAVTVSRRAFTGLTAGPSRRPSVKVAASAEVPPNVQEARAWIAAWRAKQGRMAPAEVAAQAPVSAPAHTNGKSKSNKEPKAAATASQAAPAAPTPAAKPNNKYGPSRSFDDGTLVFTADQLTSVKYSDVKLRK